MVAIRLAHGRPLGRSRLARPERPASWPGPLQLNLPPTSVDAVCLAERMRRVTSAATEYWPIARRLKFSRLNHLPGLLEDDFHEGDFPRLHP